MQARTFAAFRRRARTLDVVAAAGAAVIVAKRVLDIMAADFPVKDTVFDILAAEFLVRKKVFDILAAEFLVEKHGI